MLYENFKAVVLHCGNSEFRVFLRKIVKNIKIFRSYLTSDADDTVTQFSGSLSTVPACMLPELHARCYFTPNRLVWSLPVT